MEFKNNNPFPVDIPEVSQKRKILLNVYALTGVSDADIAAYNDCGSPHAPIAVKLHAMLDAARKTAPMEWVLDTGIKTLFLPSSKMGEIRTWLEQSQTHCTNWELVAGRPLIGQSVSDNCLLMEKEKNVGHDTSGSGYGRHAV